MEDFNTYEYGAEQKSEGKYRTMKILLLIGYILFAAVYFAVIYITRIFPLGALIPIALWVLIYFTWRYTSPDYIYTVESGNLTFFVSYTKKKRIKKTEFKISSAVMIAPRDTSSARVSDFAPQKSYSAVPSVSSKDVYTALYTDKNGKRCAFTFIATSKALKLLHFYNSKTEISATEV